MNADTVRATCGGCGHPLHAPNLECWWVDLTACPYYRYETGLSKEKGTCSFGCWEEPACMTNGPLHIDGPQRSWDTDPRNPDAECYRDLPPHLRGELIDGDGDRA